MNRSTELFLTYVSAWTLSDLIVDLPIQLTPGLSMIWSGDDRSIGAIAAVIGQTCFVAIFMGAIVGTLFALVNIATINLFARCKIRNWSWPLVMVLNGVLASVVLDFYVDAHTAHYDPHYLTILISGSSGPTFATIIGGAFLAYAVRHD